MRPFFSQKILYLLYLSSIQGVAASDVDFVRGRMPFVATSSDVPPLVPGRDFCGLVVKGSIDMLGKVEREALIPLSLISLDS